MDNVDEVLAFHNDFLSGCLKDCMLTSPELLRMISKLTSICVSFASFIEVSMCVFVVQVNTQIGTIKHFCFIPTISEVKERISWVLMSVFSGS